MKPRVRWVWATQCWHVELPGEHGAVLAMPCRRWQDAIAVALRMHG